MKKTKLIFLFLIMVFMLLISCKHEATVILSESEHMVLTNSDNGIKIHLRNLPVDSAKIKNDSRITVGDSNIFISLDDYTSQNYVLTDLIYPFVENENSYIFTLKYNYKNFAGKEIRISEKAKITADVKNPKQNPLNIDIAKKLSLKVTWSTEDRCFYYNADTALENMEGLFNEFQPDSCTVASFIYGDNSYELLSMFQTNTYANGTFTYTNNGLDEDLLSKNQRIMAVTENLPVLIRNLNKNNNYTYTTRYLFEFTDLENIYFSYEPKSWRKDAIIPMYSEQSFIGSWKENTDSEIKELIVIDECGFISINNGQSYGFVYYESDPEITCKLTGGTILKLQFLDDKLTNTETGVEYVKVPGIESVETIIESKFPDEINISVEVQSEYLYIDIDSDEYYISYYEIDGIPKNKFSNAKSPYIGNLEPGIHLITVFFSKKDNEINSYKTYSKTFNFEIK